MSPFSRRYYNSPYITTVTYAKIRDDILPSHTPNSKLVRRSCGLWLQSPSRWNHWRSSTLPLLPRSPQYPRLPAQPCFTPRLSLSYWGISLNNCPLPPWDESSLAGEEGEVERVWGGRGGGRSDLWPRMFPGLLIITFPEEQRDKIISETFSSSTTAIWS